ncbi:MAG: hypothetical protein QXR09_04045 [Candidatus Aenigmatarchaeota archaeon]
MDLLLKFWESEATDFTMPRNLYEAEIYDLIKHEGLEEDKPNSPKYK